MHNSVGNYRTTDRAMMRAFDQLPRSVRAALRDSIENWAPQPMRTMFEKRGIPAQELVKLIGKWDADELAKREHQRARATGLYKGNFPDDLPPPTRQPKRRATP